MKRANRSKMDEPPAGFSPARRIVGIGASAGGLEAFTELVKNLPVDSGLGYVLVQHLDPTHRSLLTELLGRSASLPVREIEDNDRVAANQIYVIPPNSELTIRGGTLHLTPRERASGPARSIDHFLRSLAADQGCKAIGVILSGAGSDGAKGMRAIKEAGGITFAQDEASSKYDSMPRSAIGTGCVDFVLPPAKLAAKIAHAASLTEPARARAVARARGVRAGLLRVPRAASAASAALITSIDPDLRKIFLLLRAKTAIDFSLYRPNTIRRRLARRMNLRKLKRLESYYRILREDTEELLALHQDLLINVTSFFRNPRMFETVKERVFPKIVRNGDNAESVRIWVAGCATGQEPYSYAMAFSEFAEEAGVRVPVQIFATDVNAEILEQARSGYYREHDLQGLSAARRQKFLRSEGDGYRIVKPIRDMVIFAQQNLLTDPPFTRMDLISCRNMLIYIEPSLQQQIIPTFHHALRGGGCLVLGASETVGAQTNLFQPLDKGHKIYIRRSTAGYAPGQRPLAAAAPLRIPPRELPRRETEPSVVDAYREADRLTIARYAPPGALVNDDGEVLQFRGKVQPYLEIPSGKATHNIVKMARGGLALPLQKGLRRARVENRPVRERAVPFDRPSNVVQIDVVPFRSLQTRCYLVLFDRPPQAKPAPVAKGSPRGAAGRSETRRLAEMRRELADTRAQFESLREQYDTSVEELQASNEEVQATNEELQSLNEELETSNEELESVNEELTTLNEELATRNTELRESEQRLREQAQLVELAPLLARSSKDRIIFWNRGAEKLYGYTREEAIGQTSHLLLAAEYPEPMESIQAALARDGRWEGEVRHRRKDGVVLSIATQWVLNVDEHDEIQAVLEMNTDITSRRRAEESLRKEQELNQRILESTPDAILVLDLAGRIQFVNEHGCDALALRSAAKVEGRHWTELWIGESRSEAENACRAAVGGETARFVPRSDQQDGQPRWWDVVLRPILDAGGHAERLLAVCRDITERKQAELAATEEARMAALRADVAVEVARGGELDPILQQLARTIAHHASAVQVQIWTVEGEPPHLRLNANAGVLPHLDNRKSRVAPGEGRIGRIASTRRAHITHQPGADPGLCDPEWARRESIESFAGYPLLFESRLLGVIGVFSRTRLEPRILRELALSADAIPLLIQRKHADDERNRLLEESVAARNAALAASRAKDQFLATLSHELRTPLNPVLLLASDGAENAELPANVRGMFETIRSNVSLEAKLIDDLLDLTRIAHGKLAFDVRSVDINAAIAESVSIVSARSESEGLRFSPHFNASASWVAGDPVRLQQVFWNVLNNAVKFTPPGGTITIKTSNPEPSTVRVAISDTGVGLDEADLERIFDPFSQVERRYGGLGLGLAISRQLLDKHGGRIRAFSDGPGNGARFEIDLPVASPVANGSAGNGKRAASRRRTEGSGGSAPPEGAAPQKKLLLVEDHASTRTVLGTLLTHRNFDVVTAGTLEEARQRIGERNYDVVISDLGLPDGDGHTLLAELREKQPGVVGIALSGYGTAKDRARSQEAGFNHHLTKPVSIDALDQVIAESLVGG